MNKRLLAVVSLLLVLTAACSANKTTSSIILLATWSEGRIQLAPGTTIKDTENVTFSVDNQQVALASLTTYKWVNFQKVDDSQPATFTVVSPALSEVSTHIVLAKPTTGQEICPPWASKTFGAYCQSESLSVP